MKGYLGETDVTSEHQGKTPVEWVMLFIEKYGGIDGAHHKDWVLDQVVRILKGTPMTVKKARWTSGTEELRYNLGDPPPEYWAWVAEMKGDDGQGGDEYDYDHGIAP